MHHFHKITLKYYLLTEIFTTICTFITSVEEVNASPVQKYLIAFNYGFHLLEQLITGINI